MKEIATWVDKACSEIAGWLPGNAALGLILAIVVVILAWLLLPLFIARIVVSRRAGRSRPSLRVRTQVADQWRSIIGKAFTVPPVVLAALYTLFQIGQMSRAAREAAEATFLETHKNAFDALAMNDAGHHIAAALALGQLLQKPSSELPSSELHELRRPILSALSNNAVAWSLNTTETSHLREDVRTALDVISLRPRDEEVDCINKQEAETTLWFARGNFRGMPFPILGDENGKRQGVQLDRAYFRQSDLSGSDLFCASLGYANLDSATLDGANLIEANFCGAHLIEAKLRPGENLASPGVQDATNSPVLAHKANFRAAALQHAKLMEAVFEEAVFDEARLDEADVSRAEFKCARAEKAHFNHATLEGSNFSNAFLKGADFSNAIINNSTNWDNANLESAKFSDTPDLLPKLKKARLCHTKVGDKTVDNNCNDPWNDPPKDCFTKTEAEVCSRYALVRSPGGLKMIRDLRPANRTP